MEAETVEIQPFGKIYVWHKDGKTYYSSKKPCD